MKVKCNRIISSKLISLFVVVFSIGLFLSLLTPAQTIGMEKENEPTNGVVKGVVTDAQTNGTISNAFIKLKYHEIVRTQLTDSNGQYKFDNVPICFCLKNITASKTGYISQSILVSVSEITQVDFTLNTVEDSQDSKDANDSKDSSDTDDPKDSSDSDDTDDTDDSKDDNEALFGVIIGTVNDAVTNMPVPNVLIKLEYHETARTALTNSDGQYTFTDVPICFCLKTITASANGYESQSQSVGISEMTIVDFSLDPIEDEDIVTKGDPKDRLDNIQINTKAEQKDNNLTNNFIMIISLLCIVMVLIALALIFFKKKYQT